LTNIDPVYFITPAATLAIVVALVLYWRSRRTFAGKVLLYSLVAYAGAIALKYAVQIPTIGSFEAATGGSPVALGVYYGAQTAVFEVGGAYMVARYLVSKGRLSADDSEAYGLGLAFWENAVFFAAPLLLDYLIYYAILSGPGTSAAHILYPVLAKDSPGLFLPPQAALPLVGYAILERVSSLFAHLAWGVLCVLSVVWRKKVYLAVALPIGFLIDFLVPFAGRIGTGTLEATIFAISALAFAGALHLTRSTRSQREPPQAPASG